MSQTRHEHLEESNEVDEAEERRSLIATVERFRTARQRHRRLQLQAAERGQDPEFRTQLFEATEERVTAEANLAAQIAPGAGLPLVHNGVVYFPTDSAGVSVVQCRVLDYWPAGLRCDGCT
jgi:hypothetical protein